VIAAVQILTAVAIPAAATLVAVMVAEAVTAGIDISPTTRKTS
jgi:hypothetical protein